MVLSIVLIKSFTHDDWRRFEQASEATVLHNKSFNLEYHIVRGNGDVRYIDSHGKLNRDKDGKPISVTGVVQDITERKQTEIALNRSNRAPKVLNKCNHTIVHATSGQEMINEICKAIVGTSGYRFAWVGYARSDEKKTIYPVVSAGYEAGYLDNDFSWYSDIKKTDPVSEVINPVRQS